MKSESILFALVGVFFAALIVLVIFIYKPAFPPAVNQFLNQKKSNNAVTSDADPVGDLKSRIKGLEQEQKSQNDTLENLKAFVSTQSAEEVTPTPLPINKTILAEAHTQNSSFTTTSTSYTPMGMFVNINCPKNCTLWINFYASSKNLGEPTSAQGNTNTFDIFLNNNDQSIYSQASYYAASSATSISLNASLPVSVGVHLVEIKAKTTGGTLQSDSSFLQVMAIER